MSKQILIEFQLIKKIASLLSGEKTFPNFESENRVFIIFNTTSPEMVKLTKGNKFIYKGEIYQIEMRMPPDIDHPTNTQFDCLKIVVKDEGKSKNNRLE